MIEAGVWSVLPPLIAIALALITKEVYSSLFLGVISGMLIYTFAAGEPIIAALAHLVDMMAGKIADNSYMIIFLALLWGVVVLVNESGGSLAYGKWARKHLKTRRSARFATAILGMLIFIDDGFNCLTVGTVMRPIYDQQKISREKLAYLIDATAAPVCIIAPVSSWAVAVASEVSSANGFNAFLSTIPFNFYALFTIIAVLFICWTGRDFGPMKKAEEDALNRAETEAEEIPESRTHGTVADLAVPIVVLIICAIAGMAYVGGFFSGVSFSEAIGYNPTAGLTLGAIGGLAAAFIMYIPRKLMTARQFVEHIVKGISNIVPPMLILVLSWSLGGVCREMIGTGIFISGFVSSSSLPLWLLPIFIFAIAAVMSFSMGTSWGTFGILIPIVTMICTAEGAGIYLIPALGATLAGSVYGDHCSPISDTTILSSTGADVQHIRHVETQIPYATAVAAVCALSYLIAGLTGNAWISLAIGTAVLLAGLTFFTQKTGE